MTEGRVQVWFSNRRARFRKQQNAKSHPSQTMPQFYPQSNISVSPPISMQEIPYAQNDSNFGQTNEQIQFISQYPPQFNYFYQNGYQETFAQSQPISNVSKAISPSFPDNSHGIPSPNSSESDASGSPPTQSYHHPTFNSMHDLYSNQVYDLQNYQPINYSTF